MKRVQFMFAAACLSLAASFSSGGTATAATLIQVTGIGSSSGDATPQFPDRSSAAISFTLNEAFTGVDFRPEFICLTCEISFYLTRNSIGPSSSISDLIAVAPSITDSSAPVFTGLDLAAGQYFVTAFVLDRNFLWVASSNPDLTQISGASNDLDYFATNGSLSYPPRSDFVEFTAGSFHYQLTGERLSQVPLPAAGLMFPLGLMMLFGIRRTKI